MISEKIVLRKLLEKDNLAQAFYTYYLLTFGPHMSLQNLAEARMRACEVYADKSLEVYKASMT